ncbi:MAG: hypothetical protein ABWK53_10695 [Anaerolineales bacterium]
MSIWKVNIDNLDKLYVMWAFLFQIALIIHFAVRKPFLESYTLKYGWVVYALCVPAAIISILLLRGGKSWPFWVGGFLFVVFAAFGYWVDYVAQIPFRNPARLSVLLPYVFLYLATVMFYWWPIALLSRILWIVYAALFVIATVLNITSH